MIHPRTLRYGLLFILLPLLPSLKAQEPKPLDHGAQVLKRAEALKEQDRKAELLDLYATVNRNDSAYERALLGTLAALSDMKRWAEMPAICDKGIALDGPEARTFHLYKGSALIMQKEHDAAQASLDRSIALYPGNFKLRHLRALNFQERGDHAAYFKALQENAQRFPLQREVHVALGNLAQKEGRTAQAALAFHMALLSRWGDDYASRILVHTDELLAGKLDVEKTGLDIGEGDLFAEVDLLLANKVAMSSKYKCKPDLTYPFVRQSHLLMNEVKDMPRDQGFWSGYYVPFFQQIMKDGKFGPLMLHGLHCSGVPEVRAIATKKSREVEAFRAQLNGLFLDNMAQFPDTLQGEKVVLYHSWNRDGDLFGIGRGDIDQGKAQGPWVIFDEKGYVSARGAFNEGYKRDGTWVYYDAPDRLSAVRQMKDGVEDGPSVFYHDNGTISDSVGFVNGKTEGFYTARNVHGALVSKRTMVNGVANGPAKYFHECDALDYEAQLADERLQGDVVRFYPDGVKRATMRFAKGQRDGEVVEFHHNGQVASRVNYVQGKGQGAFKYGHENGQDHFVGTLRNDELFGKRSVYYPTGTLNVEENYDDQGRNSGTFKFHTPEGRLHYEMEYNKGLLVRYKYLDPAGKVVQEGTRAKGRFRFKGTHPDGSLRMEGEYFDEGAKDGAWAWYWPDGTVQERENLTKGTPEGVQTTYHENGDVHNEYRYLPGKGRVGPYSRKRVDGSVQLEGYVVDGKHNGEFFRRYLDGSLMDEEYYSDDELHGWQRYYAPDHTLTEERRYVEGKLHECILYAADGKVLAHVQLPPGPFLLALDHPDGTPKSRIHYMNRVRHGLIEQFFPNGSKFSEGHYVNGKADGVWKYWHPNGVLSSEQRYVFGELNGASRNWNVGGVLLSEEEYVDDYSIGSKTWHVNGKPAITREKRYGQEHGTTNSYDMTGELQLVRYYSNDQLIGYAFKGADGVLVDTIPLAHGLAPIQSKFQNGRTSREMPYRNGDLHGPFREYHANGRSMAEVPYVAGFIHGVRKEFLPDGKPMFTGEWVAGVREGEHVDHWDNGAPMDRTTWRSGKRHGPRVLYDRNGKAVWNLEYYDDELISMRKS